MLLSRLLSTYLLQLPLTNALSDNGAPAGHLIDIDQEPKTALDATAWALIYTYPLAIFASWSGGVFQHVGVNEIYHQRRLATPNDPGVIKPNVDTLYSKAVLDLSTHDVVLTIPEINDGRYWLYPIYDPFGNNIAEIGIVNGNKAGKYLIRRADDVFDPPGYINATGELIDDVFHPKLPQDFSEGCNETYQGIVNIPGTYGTLLQRLFLKSNTTEDLEAIHKYQNASHLTPIPRKANFKNGHAPPLNSTAFNGTFLGIQTPARQLEFAARLAQYNQPQIYSQRYRVASILARAGIYDGHFHASSGINLTEAAVIANASIVANVEAPKHIREQSNEWQLSIPSFQGNFGTNYASAAYVALFGYQQLTTHQVLYPGFRSLGFTSSFHLEKNKALLFTFAGKPKLFSEGFWSLTVYGDDQYLIPNPLDRYEAGDRTHSIQYQDGSGPVYGDKANSSHDGPFQVLAQPVDQPPPKNWTGNWLPVKSDFSLILRWYTPEPAMTNGSYIYPKIENITAIV